LEIAKGPRAKKGTNLVSRKTREGLGGKKGKKKGKLTNQASSLHEKL